MQSKPVNLVQPRSSAIKENPPRLSAPLLLSALFWFVYHGVFAPHLEPFLMMASAKVAAFYRGMPAIATADYSWVLSLSSFDLRVTSACSGVAFCGMLCTLAFWLYLDTKQYRRGLLPLISIPLSAIAFTVLLNAIRIHLAGEIYFWFQEGISEGWQTRAHLVLGILIFLPGLTLWFYMHAKKWSSYE